MLQPDSAPCFAASPAPPPRRWRWRRRGGGGAVRGCGRGRRHACTQRHVVFGGRWRAARGLGHARPCSRWRSRRGGGGIRPSGEVVVRHGARSWHGCHTSVGTPAHLGPHSDGGATRSDILRRTEAQRRAVGGDAADPLDGPRRRTPFQGSTLTLVTRKATGAGRKTKAVGGRLAPLASSDSDVSEGGVLPLATGERALFGRSGGGTGASHRRSRHAVPMTRWMREGKGEATGSPPSLSRPERYNSLQAPHPPTRFDKLYISRRTVAPVYGLPLPLGRLGVSQRALR